MLKLAADHFDDQLSRLVTDTADFSLRGGRLDLDILRNEQAQEAHLAAAKLQDQVNTWVELNQQRTNRWHALRLALRSCIKHPIIGDTIAAIKAGEQGDSAAVRLFVNTYSTHTIHLPLRDVPRALTIAGIVRAGRLLARALRKHFARERPVIGVLGLNPHAGEPGHLGDEEITTVAPAVAELSRGASEHGEPAIFRGLLPADTAFAQHADGLLDGVVAMYHDQGLAPFKLLHMRHGVNMTLGLPFVRTSPDHGTARDIAGHGVPVPSSMFAAIAYARGHVP